MNLSWLLCFHLLITAVSSDVGENGQYVLQKAGRDVIRPKVFILSTFAPEANAWYQGSSLDLFANNITIPGLSPIWPDVHCDSGGEVCQLTTGLGVVNAAASLTVLWSSPRFDLRETYFLIAAIAGINPHEATITSVTFAPYVVTLDTQYAASALEIPNNYSSGWLPLRSELPDTTDPAAYPTLIFGWEAFELNAKLMRRAMAAARKAKLEDTPATKVYRALYDYAPANEPPGIVSCVSGASNAYWAGHAYGEAFQNYTRLMTNGSGTYCATNTEDSGIHEALVRGHVAGKLDYSRVINMRTASNFDRPPPGVGALSQLLYRNQGGHEPALKNIYLAGIEVVRDVVDNWNGIFESGIKPDNYIGDMFGSIKNQAAPRDLGPPSPPPAY